MVTNKTAQKREEAAASAAFKATQSAFEKVQQAQEKVYSDFSDFQTRSNKWSAKIDERQRMTEEYLHNLDNQRKAELYKQCTPSDCADLDLQEKVLLVSILYQLATNEKPTEYQAEYIRTVQRHLKISDPQTTCDYSVIEDIDSMTDRRTMLQVVMEYLYLSDAERSDDIDILLNSFCVSSKAISIIQNNIETIVNLVGLRGLVEKFGFDPDVITTNNTSQSNTNRDQIDKEWIEVEKVWKQFEEVIQVGPYIMVIIPDCELIGEDYYSKQQATYAAATELSKLYDTITPALNPSSNSSLAIRALNSISEQLDSGVENLKLQIRIFAQKTGYRQEAQKMEELLNLDEFRSSLKNLFVSELDSNRYKYSLEPISSYSNEIIIESDYLGLETGFRRFFEKMSEKWTYNLCEASIKLTDDFNCKQASFSSAATSIVKRELRTNIFTKLRAIYANLV